jgi:hypothetical protein
MRCEHPGRPRWDNAGCELAASSVRSKKLDVRDPPVSPFLPERHFPATCFMAAVRIACA